MRNKRIGRKTNYKLKVANYDKYRKLINDPNQMYTRFTF